MNIPSALGSIALFAVALALIGCGSALGEIGEIKVIPSATLAPGQSATLYVDVVLGPDDTIVWKSEPAGTFLAPDQPSTTFVAPDSGPVIVTCTVKSDGRVVSRSIPIEVHPTDQPSSAALPVDGRPQAASSETADIEMEGFIPSGFMGDGEEPGNVVLDEADCDQPHSAPNCLKWTYKPATKGWAAVAWQFPENNWGDELGKDWSDRGFRSVRVWARGVPNKREKHPRIQIKAGGNTTPKAANPASFALIGPFVELSPGWREICIDIPEGKDLSNIVSPVTLVVTKAMNPEGAVFYLDDLTYSASSCDR